MSSRSPSLYHVYGASVFCSIERKGKSWLARQEGVPHVELSQESSLFALDVSARSQPDGKVKPLHLQVGWGFRDYITLFNWLMLKSQSFSFKNQV